MLSTLLVLALLPAAPPDPSPAEAPAVAAVSGEGAEEAEAEAAGAARLAAANEALLQARPLDAAIEAHRALAILKPSAEKYESAEFLLAEALVALGLEQGAAELYFAVIEQRQNPALLPRALAGLERLARRGRLDDERLLRSSPTSRRCRTRWRAS
jgi:TolA-binding protein